MNQYVDDMPSTKRLTTYLATITFVASSLALFANATISAFGYDVVMWLNNVLFEFGETGIVVSYAHALSIASIAGVYFGSSKDDSFSDFTDQQGTLALGTTAVMVLTILSPELVDYVTATNNRAMAFVGLLLVGWVSIIESQEIREAMGR